MATSYNSETQYTRILGDFRGVDLTSPDAEVNIKRFSYIKNMYRNYSSGAGTAIETVPGYRCILPPPDSGEEQIYGIWSAVIDSVRKVLVHRGTKLLIFDHSDRDALSESGNITAIGGLAAHKSAGVIFLGSFYILDGTHFYRLDGDSLTDILTDAYLPVTYVNGEMYEQRNMLADRTVNRDTQPQEASYIAFYSIRTSGSQSMVMGFRNGYSGDVAVIPDGYSVDPYAFSGNTDIKKVALISGNNANFSGCTSLAEIYAGGPIDGSSYTGCTALKTIKILSGIITGVFPDGAIETAYLGTAASLLIDGAPTFGGALRRSIAVYTEKTADRLSSDWGESWAEATALAYHVGHVLLDGVEKATGQESCYKTSTAKPPDGFIFPDTSAEGEYVTFDDGGSYTVMLDGQSRALQFAGSAQLVTTDTPITVPVYVDGLRLYDNSDYNYASPVSVDVVEIGGAVYEAVAGTFTPDTTISVTSNTPTPSIFDTDPDTKAEDKTFRELVCYDPAVAVESVKLGDNDARWWGTVWHTIDGKRYADRVILADNPNFDGKDTDVTLQCYPGEFKSAAGQQSFSAGNPEYSGTSRDAICQCTVAAAFDGRLFLTGNPALPNTLFWCARDLSAVARPEYFGQLNYTNDGDGHNPIVALLPTASMIMALKGDDPDAPTIYYHAGADTGNDVLPRIYPAEAGVAGLGCSGAAHNFFDDPVFMSHRGLEAVGKQQVNLERTITHRSAFVDGELTREELENTLLATWGDYLAVFTPSGNVYLADSRQVSQDSAGMAAYEWYRMENIGHYYGQRRDYVLTTGDVYMYPKQGDAVWLGEGEYYVQHDGSRVRLVIGSGEHYADATEVYSSGIYADTVGSDVFYSDAERTAAIVAYFTFIDGEAYLCEPSERYSGGAYRSVSAARNIDGVLYFGTEDGALMAFNDDKRGVSYNNDFPGPDAIHDHWYTFDGRPIHSMAVTASDTAGYPGIAKKTVKKSLVLYAKNLDNSRITVKVRTNRTNDWKYVGDVSAATYRPGATDFANAALQLSEERIGTIREKEKKWAVKQLLFESGDRFMCPIGIYSLSYRYTLKGRIKA